MARKSHGETLNFAAGILNLLLLLIICVGDDLTGPDAWVSFFRLPSSSLKARILEEVQPQQSPSYQRYRLTITENVSNSLLLHPHRSCSPGYHSFLSCVCGSWAVNRSTKVLTSRLLSCSSVIAQPLGFASPMRALACLQPFKAIHAFSLFFSFYSQKNFLICM